MEKRPPLPEVVAPPVTTETVADATAETADAASASEAVVAEPEVAAATDSIADVTNDATTEVTPPAESASTDTSASRLPEVNFAPPPEPAEPVVEAAVAETPAESAVVGETTETAAVETSAGEAAPDQVATEATASAEPVLVEVWAGPAVVPTSAVRVMIAAATRGRINPRLPQPKVRPLPVAMRSASVMAAIAATATTSIAGHALMRRRLPAEGAGAAQARPPGDDKGGRPPREGFKGKDRNQERGKGKFDKRGRDGAQG